MERPAPGPLGEGPRTGDPLGSGAGAPGSLGPDRSAPAELATEAGAAGPYGVGQSDPAASGAGPGGADSAGGERSPLPASGTGGRASAALAAGAYVNGASGAGQAVPGALAAERSGVGALEVLDPLLSRQGAARDACRGGGSYGDDWLARRSGQDGAWLGRGALSFLAEASDLLAGQLDEDLVASLTGQLIVPRLADWCAVWLEDETTGHGGASGPRLARVWHAGEDHIEDLGAALRHNPPHPGDPADPGPAPYPWPEEALDAPADGHPAGGTPPHVTPGTALAYRLVAGGRPLGSLVIGRGGIERFPDEITGLVEDLTRRVALAIGAARQYSRQATISAVLQRGLLPGAVAEIPGVRTALVYEPCDKGGPSGDFYDLFPAGQGRWCFAVGDVQGKGPEAAVVIGLVRPWLRLLAREGYRVADVLDRLNQLLLDDATEAADAAARALVAAGARPTAPGDGPQTRFLSLLYGELVPFADGFRCTLASAGHPLPCCSPPTARSVPWPSRRP
ncbi:hypothetical protein SHKM778_78020 [Streptomyces sp. KM77-8]|uniref:PPM-type phosphatase domain-containing protein n=1 Tax=Streptomyces haneummycinicus TaxID=3074435 RepID=A0AAT9HV57_9ACTN